MAAGGHFGCPNFFWSKFLTKWRPVAILDVWKSLFIVFLAISDRYETFNIFWNLKKNCHRRPFWMSISERSTNLYVRNSLSIAFLAISDRYGTFYHFQSLSIDTKLFFWSFWQNGRRRSFWMGRQCQLSNSSEIFGWVMHVPSL